MPPKQIRQISPIGQIRPISQIGLIRPMGLLANGLVLDLYALVVLLGLGGSEAQLRSSIIIVVDVFYHSIAVARSGIP